MDNSFTFLEQYAQQILDGAGFEGVPEEDRKAALGQMTAQLQERIGAALIQEMSDESAAQFAKMLDDDADQAAHEAFWRESVPQYDEIVKSQMEAFKKDFLATAKGVE